MSNKIFIPFLILLAAGFFGWMLYDSWLSSREVRKQQSKGGMFLDAETGTSALIQYNFLFPKQKYSHELNTDQITALARSEGENTAGRVLGFTVADYQIKSLFNYRCSKKWFKKEYNLWVENLRVDFSYNTLTVYVSSNYPVESCEYQAVLDHENQHVEINRQVYAEYTHVLKDVVGHSAVIPLAGRPLRTSTAERGQEILDKILEGVTQPVYNEFKRTLDEKQAVIDSRENRRKFFEQCRNW